MGAALNGGFYVAEDPPDRIDELLPELERWLEEYNNLRPHWGLGGMTPASYVANHQRRESQESHML